MPADPLHAHLLRAFRSAMPGASGVVLASDDGRAWAHDVDGDADALVATARASLSHGASALVPHAGGLVLVVQMPPGLARTSA